MKYHSVVFWPSLEGIAGTSSRSLKVGYEHFNGKMSIEVSNNNSEGFSFLKFMNFMS